MMRYCVIGFIAGIAASIGWKLAPHGMPAAPLVPVAMAASPAPSHAHSHSPAPMPTPAPAFDVAPLIVTTAAPSAEPVVAGFASIPAPPVAPKAIAPAPRPVVVVAKRPPSPPAAPAPPVATTAPVKDDEMMRARHDYAAATAELGATL